MRLLPEDREQGWTPYAWLVYLAFFAGAPFVLPVGHRALTIAGAAAALPLYFWGYWLRGRRVLLVVFGFLALGAIFAELNPAASVFIVYGACYLGEVGEPPAGFRYLGLLLGLVGVEAWLFRLPREFWIPALIFGALMGSVDIHYAQRRRLNAQLLRAQAEVAHLAKVAERERIARDLHDLLGHTLSVIVLKSELASKLGEKDPQRAMAEIRDVERISREALAQVRGAVRGYRL